MHRTRMRIPGLTRVRRIVETTRARRVWRNLAGAKLLRAFADEYQHPFFIEVGANDGEHHDHLRTFIRERSWAGIMVEPVPYVFERLRRNYGDLESIALENAAIADRDGLLPFYYLAEDADADRLGLPGWYDAIGSFSRETVLEHGAEIPEIESRIVETDVPCLTFESLCRKHGVEALDLLCVDTEGYDYELLRTIDLAARHPRLLIYEHFHLEPAERGECATYVRRQGYETMEEGFDTWCLDTSIDDHLTSTWRNTRAALPGQSVHDLPRAAPAR